MLFAAPQRLNPSERATSRPSPRSNKLTFLAMVKLSNHSVACNKRRDIFEKVGFTIIQLT